jgi:hypothetical protein
MTSSAFVFVMPGVMPGIHVLLHAKKNKDVDGRHTPAMTME